MLQLDVAPGAAAANTISRRRFGVTAAAAILASAIPWATASAAKPLGRPAKGTRVKRLVLLEMQGGNDALNTLIPYRDPLYTRYRPSIGVPERERITLTDDLAFNGALRRLTALNQSGELAIVQDVGYPHPNLSHFESAAIWASGHPEQARSEGWAARTIERNRRAVSALGLDADGIVLGGNADFLAGQATHVLAIDDPKAFVASPSPQISDFVPATTAARRLMAVVEDTTVISARLHNKLVGANRFDAWVSQGHYIEAFGGQLALLLRIIEAGGTAPAYKVSLSGFDMHAGLRGQHEALLGRFDAGMSMLARGLKEIGVWDDTLVIAASEFGRRPQENASGGTDHGTAGPVFMMGGGIKGGVYGRRADLAKLDGDGNPTFTTDFRSIYALIIDKFWKLDENPMRDLAEPIDVAFA